MATPGFQKNYNLWRDLLSSDIGVAHRVVSYITTVPMVFLQRNLGERYLDATGVGASFLFMAALFFGARYLAQKIDEWFPLPFIELGNLFSPLVVGFVAAFMIAVVIQFWLQFKNVRDHDRERPHSYSLGEPVLPLHRWLPFSENVQIKFVHPFLVLVLGLMFFASVDRFFGSYVILMAGFLLLESWFEWNSQREIVLMAHDARRFAVALAQWQAQESAFGSSVMKPVPVTPAHPSRLYKTEPVAPVVTANGAEPQVGVQVAMFSLVKMARVRRGYRERPHSYSLGEPVLPLHRWLPFSENVQIKFVHPFLVLVLGLMFFASVDRFFGSYVILMAGFLLLESWFEWNSQREIVLMAHDARRFAVALAQWQAQESAFGSSVMKPVPVTPAHPSRLYKTEPVAPVVTANGAEPQVGVQVAMFSP